MGFLVIEEDGAAIRLEDVGCDLDHLLEELIEGERFRDIADHLKQRADLGEQARDVTCKSGGVVLLVVFKARLDRRGGELVF
jgi:hypothetical protein